MDIRQTIAGVVTLVLLITVIFILYDVSAGHRPRSHLNPTGPPGVGSSPVH
jgi:hypothetical protein